MTLKGTCEGLILKADHDLHKYYVEFKNPETTNEEKAWVKVDDLTCLQKKTKQKGKKMLELTNIRKSAWRVTPKRNPKHKN